MSWGFPVATPQVELLRSDPYYGNASSLRTPTAIGTGSFQHNSHVLDSEWSQVRQTFDDEKTLGSGQWQGALGPEARTWLEDVALDKLRKERGIVADIKPHMKQKVVWHALAEIGVALMRSQAGQIVLHAVTMTLPRKCKRKPARAR